MPNSVDTNKPVALALIELVFRSVDFCGGRKTGEPGHKPSEQGKNQQQTQPTRDDEYGNRTRVTEVGGQLLSTAPPVLPFEFIYN